MGFTKNLGWVSQFITATRGGNVGVSKTNPNAKLDVNGNTVITGSLTVTQPITGSLFGTATTASFVNVAGLGGFVQGGNSFGAQALIGTNDNQSLALETSGSIRMFVANSGNVGIGTTNPSYKLDIWNGSDFDARLRDDSLGGTVGLLFETANNFSGTSQAYIKGIGQGASGRSDLIFGTATNVGDITASEKLRITSQGNVGIGTTSPSRRLSIEAADTWMSFKVTGNKEYLIGQGTSDAFRVFDASADAERMRITSGGNLLLRTTVDSGYQCTIGSTAGNLMYFTLGSGNVQMFMGSNSDFYISTNNSQGVRLPVGATSWSAYSDIRLKNVTGKITNALSDVGTLSAIKFRLKSDKSNIDRVGLIAQEVQKVLPEAVDEDQTGMLSVRYTELIPLLVASIQEQQAQIKELQDEIISLKNN
jgi:hypothetical protein